MLQLILRNYSEDIGKVLKQIQRLSFIVPLDYPIIPPQSAVNSLSSRTLINHRRDNLFIIIGTQLTLQFKNNMQQPQKNIQQVLRQESLQRITNYVHPELILKHEPINAKECQDLKNELRDLVKVKVDKIRREYQAEDHNNNYNQVYGQFIQMTHSNQAQQQDMCNSIKYMHQLADCILNPPAFGKDLYLSSKQTPTMIEAEQFQKIYEYYQKMYKSGERKEESQAQQAIKRAKEYILRPQAS